MLRVKERIMSVRHSLRRARRLVRRIIIMLSAYFMGGVVVFLIAAFLAKLSIMLWPPT